MYWEWKVGPQVLTDGAAAVGRLCKDGTVATQHAHGRYQEAVVRGILGTTSGVFSVCSGSVTIASANVISATPPQPILGLVNPGPKLLVILRAVLLVVSGTLGTGGFSWGVLANQLPNVTAAGGSAAAFNNGTFLSTGYSARTFQNAAMTQTTAAAPNRLRPFGGGTTGAVAANQSMVYSEETAGDIVVPVNGLIGLFAEAAGTSPVVFAGISWEEVTS